MRLNIFQSDKGDCVLLEGRSGHRILCDGGMKSSLEEHVRDELSKLRDAGEHIDLVYVSHIDQDHISGVLQLLEDEAEWRVFDHHEATNDPIREPDVPRPPEMRGIMHNAFRDQITANNRALENLLIASAPAWFASAVPELIEVATEMQEIAVSIPEALKVSGLVKADALDIPLNRPPGVAQGSKLLFAGQPGDTFTLGSMEFTLIGPTKRELTNLRRGWNNWLRRSPDRVRAIRAEIRDRIERFSNGALTTSPYDLRDWEGIPGFKGVTVPNVASLMFMVEEEDQKVLLTGDGQQDFIIKGLERTGFLDPGFIHLDVLKVQHHGSENNMDRDFARQVSADHYVFCGNGDNTNPEISVIDIIFQSRMGDASVRTLAPEAQNRDFHFWFSTTSDNARPGSTVRRNFREIESHVADLEQQSNGRLHLHFNERAFTTLTI